MMDLFKKIGKKTMILVVGFLILIIVILFGGAFIYNKFFYKRSYSEIENIMVDASKKYYSENKDELSDTLNSTVNISADALASSGNMKQLSEYLKDDSVSCNGQVNVTNLGKDYRYTSVLDCGDKYKTKTLIDYLKNNVAVVESGNGLYNLNNEFVYRGDKVNNYIKFYSNDRVYRIVKFTDNYISMIYTDKIDSAIWDDRYNIEEETEVGINNYSVSRIKDTLQNLYKSNSIFNSYAKNLIITHKVGIGKRGSNDGDKSGNMENSVYVDNQYLGLLPIYDFMNASIDKNCNSTVSPSCQNYNYLSKYSSSWWTSTASNENTYKAYKVLGGSYVTASSTDSDSRPRFVVYANKDALYVSGDGTKKNPYIIK